MATILGFSEWEAGSTARAVSTSGTAVIENSGVKKNSTRTLRIQPSAGNAFQIWTIGKSSQGAPTALERTANTYYYATFRFETLPPSSTHVPFITILSNALSTCVKITTNDAGAVLATGATTSGSAGTIKTWVYYTLRMRLLSNGASEFQLNDGVGGSWRTAATFTAANFAQTYIVFGNNVGADASTFLVRFGDWFVTSDGFVVDDVFFRITCLRPVADGTYTAWADTPDGASDYLTVDDEDDDGDTSYISSATSGQASTFQMTPVSSTVIRNCTILAVMSRIVVRDTTGASAVQVRLRSGSTDDDTDSNDPGSGSFQSRTKVYNTDPATSAAWTTSGVDGIEVGVDNAASVGLRVTQVCALVLYTFTVTPFSGTTNERLEFDGTLMPSNLLQAAAPTLGRDPTDPDVIAIYFSSGEQPLGVGLEVYGAYLPSGMSLNDAVPTDWTIDTTPLVARPADDWDDLVIEVPHYINFNGTHMIFYGGIDGAYGVADAAIGVMVWDTDHWERHGDPVLEGSESWEQWNGGAFFVAEPTVWEDDNGLLHMLYTAGLVGASTNIGHATSVDGFTWSNKEQIDDNVWHNEVRIFNNTMFRYISSMAYHDADDGIYEIYGIDDTDASAGIGFQQVASFLSHIGHHEGIHGPTIEESEGKRFMYYTGRDEHNASIRHIFRAEIPYVVIEQPAVMSATAAMLAQTVGLTETMALKTATAALLDITGTLAANMAAKTATAALLDQTVNSTTNMATATAAAEMLAIVGNIQAAMQASTATAAMPDIDTILQAVMTALTATAEHLSITANVQALQALMTATADSPAITAQINALMAAATATAVELAITASIQILMAAKTADAVMPELAIQDAGSELMATMTADAAMPNMAANINALMAVLTAQAAMLDITHLEALQQLMAAATATAELLAITASPSAGMGAMTASAAALAVTAAIEALMAMLAATADSYPVTATANEPTSEQSMALMTAAAALLSLVGVAIGIGAIIDGCLEDADTVNPDSWPNNVVGSGYVAPVSTPVSSGYVGQSGSGTLWDM